MTDQRTRPSNATRDEEARDAKVTAGVDGTGGPEAPDDAEGRRERCGAREGNGRAPARRRRARAVFLTVEEVPA